MPSADSDAQATDTETVEPEQTATDESRQALLDAITAELGDAVVAHHLIPGRDLWIRVSNDAWSDTADYLRNRQRFRLFDWLSAIDWMASPFGRSLDAEVDKQLETPAVASPATDDADEGAAAAEATDDGLTGTGADGLTGGATRFQALARVYSLTTGIGVNLKADVGDDMTIGTWIDTYPGALWHEREAHEMFGISFNGNADMRNLYLPSAFEGYPLRKDFPLMARIVKPWPGIIDVEPMPELPETPEQGSGE